jgi:hypothetical protein
VWTLQEAGCRRLISNQSAGKLQSVCDGACPVLSWRYNVHLLLLVAWCNSFCRPARNGRAEASRKGEEAALSSPPAKEGLQEAWKAGAVGGRLGFSSSWWWRRQAYCGDDRVHSCGAADEIDNINDELRREKRREMTVGDIRRPRSLHVVKRQCVLLRPCCSERNR